MMDATFTFISPTCFHFILLLFFPCPLQFPCLLFSAIFSCTQTIPLITLLSGKQAPLICQPSSPSFLKLMLFHTSFILLSHPLYLVSCFMKYLSCLELILLPLIWAIRDGQCLQSHVCRWFLKAMGYVLMLFFRQKPYQFQVVGVFFLLLLNKAFKLWPNNISNKPDRWWNINIKMTVEFRYSPPLLHFQLQVSRSAASPSS